LPVGGAPAAAPRTFARGATGWAQFAGISVRIRSILLTQNDQIRHMENGRVYA